MKKNIILLVAISLSLGGCGIYTKYEDVYKRQLLLQLVCL